MPILKLDESVLFFPFLTNLIGDLFSSWLTASDYHILHDVTCVLIVAELHKLRFHGVHYAVFDVLRSIQEQVRNYVVAELAVAQVDSFLQNLFDNAFILQLKKCLVLGVYLDYLLKHSAAVRICDKLLRLKILKHFLDHAFQDKLNFFGRQDFETLLNYVVGVVVHYEPENVLL